MPPSISIWMATKPGPLRDAVVVVVGRRAHRAGHAARDAPLERAAIEPAVGAAPGGAGAAKRRPLRLVGRALLRLGRQRGHAPSGGSTTSDVRRRRHLGAAIPPEVVVGALDVAAGALRATLVAALLLRALLERGHFLRGEELPAAHVRRPLERRDGAIRVGALQIGLAPRRPRRGPFLRGRARRRRRRRLGEGGERSQHRGGGNGGNEAFPHAKHPIPSEAALRPRNNGRLCLARAVLDCPHSVRRENSTKPIRKPSVKLSRGAVTAARRAARGDAPGNSSS